MGNQCSRPPSVVTASRDVRAVDLLLVLTKAAAQSARAETILRPFPRPCNAAKCSGSKFDRAKMVAEAMPRAVSLMVDANHQDPKDDGAALSPSPTMSPLPQAESKQADVETNAMTTTVGSTSPNAISSGKGALRRFSLSFKPNTKRAHRAAAFATAKWAATTSPAKIIPLGSDEQFKGLNTPFQFLLKYKKHSAQERRFRRARKSRKTTLAWHGSRVENWHSIFRNGLKVYSGTKQQANGAAYGKGIYVSPYASTSLGYCGSGWKYSGVSGSTACANPQQDSFDNTELMTNDNVNGLRVLALCEITGSVKKGCDSVWVVENEHQIVVRALLVIPNNESPSTRAETLRANLEKVAKTHHV